MLNNINEIKEFITWAKENKVKSFKSGDLEFEISEIAMIPEEELKPGLPLADTLTDTDPEAAEDDEEALFWSAGG